MNAIAEKVLVCHAEYDALIREGIRDMLQTLREEGEKLSMVEIVRQVKALVADFYCVA